MHPAHLTPDASQADVPVPAQNSSRHRADELLLAALLGGASVRKAAKVAGIGERTAFKRLKEPGFRAELRHRREAMFRQVTGRLLALTAPALKKLKELLNCGDLQVEFRAVAKILDSTGDGAQLLDVAEQIAELQNSLGVVGEERPTATPAADDDDTEQPSISHVRDWADHEETQP